MKYSVPVTLVMIIALAFTPREDQKIKRKQELIDWIEGDMKLAFILKLLCES